MTIDPTNWVVMVPALLGTGILMRMWAQCMGWVCDQLMEVLRGFFD